MNNNLGNVGYFRGRHRGEKMLLVGAAPSLNEIDLGSFKGLASIASNRILLHPTFVPTYLVLCDRTPYAAEFSSGRLHKYVEDGGTVFASNTIWDPAIKSRGVGVLPEPEFNHYWWRCGVCSTPTNFSDFTKPMCSFGTVIGPMIQIAVLMGASEIGVVGVDLLAPLDKASLHFYTNELKNEGKLATGVHRESGTCLASQATLAALRRLRTEAESEGVAILNLSPVKDSPFADIFGNTDIEGFLQ